MRGNFHRLLPSAATGSNRFFAFASALLTSFFAAFGAELRVSSDFEGGSAWVESIDQSSRVIRFMPGGDPQRGWPCWWYLRVDGPAKDERITLSLAASDRPTRNNGTNTGKPLNASWAMPAHATFSTDGQTWRHTAPGKREGARMLYEVTGTGGSLWIAWGPPFTPHDTEALLASAQRSLRSAKSFELARTRQGRPVRGLHISEATARKPPGVWVQARQHAWESGSSWVARGFIEWLVSDHVDARWLRAHAEIFIVPIMDVDNAATGDGGKEANPRDHNRDWDTMPVYPEIAAAQERLRELAKDNRLDLFLDLHNPAPNDTRPFFFVVPAELLSESGRANRGEFLDLCRSHIKAPLALEEKPRSTGPNYHPLWRQISGQWVNDNGNPHTVAACLETSWNTAHSTTGGYCTVGRQLGLATVDYLRRHGAVIQHPSTSRKRQRGVRQDLNL